MGYTLDSACVRDESLAWKGEPMGLSIPVEP